MKCTTHLDSAETKTEAEPEIETDSETETETETNTAATTTIHSVYYDQSLISSDVNKTVNASSVSIDEFQVVEVEEKQNVSTYRDSCLVLTRTADKEEEKPIIESYALNNCSQPKHVLCETNTLVVQNFQYACLAKPLTLDLPALVSQQLTQELCLSICQELQTKLAILQMDKCYCLDGATPNLLNVTVDFEKYRQKDCGNPCPGQ